MGEGQIVLFFGGGGEIIVFEFWIFLVFMVFYVFWVFWDIEPKFFEKKKQLFAQ